MLLGWNTLIVPSGKSKDCSHTRKTFSMMYTYQRAWLLYSVKDIRKVALYRKLEIRWRIRWQNRQLPAMAGLVLKFVQKSIGLRLVTFIV